MPRNTPSSSVLIVEDDREMLILIRDVLRQEGYGTLVAGTYNAGMENIQVYSPLILLTDYDLRDENYDGGHLVQYAHQRGVQNTILWSGLDRTRELEERNIRPSLVCTKDKLTDVLTFCANIFEGLNQNEPQPGGPTAVDWYQITDDDPEDLEDDTYDAELDDDEPDVENMEDVQNLIDLNVDRILNGLREIPVRRPVNTRDLLNTWVNNTETITFPYPAEQIFTNNTTPRR